MNRYRFHCGVFLMKAFHAKIWQFAELKNPINVNPPFLPLGALQWYQKTSDCHHTRGKASNKVFDRVNILGSSLFPLLGPWTLLKVRCWLESQYIHTQYFASSPLIWSWPAALYKRANICQPNKKWKHENPFWALLLMFCKSLSNSQKFLPCPAKMDCQLRVSNFESPVE